MHFKIEPFDGKELRRRRTAAKLTIAELAQLIHVSPRSVIRWETGKCTPHAYITRRIQGVLNYQQDVFNYQKEDHPSISTAVLVVLTEAGINPIPVPNLVYLQRVFEECQKEEIQFTPQLVRTLLRAFNTPSPSG